MRKDAFQDWIRENGDNLQEEEYVKFPADQYYYPGYDVLAVKRNGKILISLKKIKK